MLGFEPMQSSPGPVLSTTRLFCLSQAFPGKASSDALPHPLSPVAVSSVRPSYPGRASVMANVRALEPLTLVESSVSLLNEWIQTEKRVVDVYHMDC